MLDAIQDPIHVSAALYSDWIITKKTNQDVLVTGQPKYKRNMIILEAVHSTVVINEDKMDAFLEALENHAIEEVVEAMHKYLGESEALSLFVHKPEPISIISPPLFPSIQRMPILMRCTARPVNSLSASTAPTIFTKTISIKIAS